MHPDTMSVVLVRVGLWSRFEVRVGLPSYAETKADGVRLTGTTDSLIGGKILLKSGDKGAVSVLGSAILPTGARRIDEHAFQPGGVLISDVNISKKIVVTTNVGYYYTSWSRASRPYLRRLDSEFCVNEEHQYLFEFYAQNLRHTWIHRYAATGGSWTIESGQPSFSGGFGSAITRMVPITGALESRALIQCEPSAGSSRKTSSESAGLRVPPAAVTAAGRRWCNFPLEYGKNCSVYFAGVFAFFGFFFSRRCLSLLIAASMPWLDGELDGEYATAKFGIQAPLFVIRFGNSHSATGSLRIAREPRGGPCKRILR
jgi:hypothetical protein